MNPIDLVPFAEHSQKLPEKFLAPDATVDTLQTGGLLAAHGIDFVLTVALSSMVSNMFQEAVQGLLVTEGLRLALAQQSPSGFLGLILPTMLLGYFFMSYFMNHGQTLGMLLLKKRIVMNSKDYKEAFKWAAHSMFLCCTWGLSFLLDKSRWNNFQNHDYLYREFISYKEASAISLIHSIDEKQSVSEESSGQDWIQAA